MGAGAIPLHVEKEFFEKAKGKYKINVYLADVTYDGDDRKGPNNGIIEDHCLRLRICGFHGELPPP